MSDALDEQLFAALDRYDLESVTGIYLQAAEMSEAEGDIPRSCFLLTQAWIYALEAGDRRAGNIRARLVAQGRETEQ